MSDETATFETLTARLAFASETPLREEWSRLTSVQPWTDRELWLLLLHDGEATPVLTQIDELPSFPDPLLLEGLMHTCRHFTDEDAAFTFAFCLVRPGVGSPGEEDRRWATGLVAAARAAGVPIETIHHASWGAVAAFTPDELVDTL